ncbi:hypothetical protein BXU09_18845 [Deinococcus sp. LM3]|nr:hypothetical protein BXU09_18845 [Deinococcus sp. LM3]
MPIVQHFWMFCDGPRELMKQEAFQANHTVSEATCILIDQRENSLLGGMLGKNGGTPATGQKNEALIWTTLQWEKGRLQIILAEQENDNIIRLYSCIQGLVDAQLLTPV